MARKFDINHASAEQLAEIEGIGPRIAEQITNYRRSHGHFSSLDDLKNVPQIDSQMIQRLKQGSEVPQDQIAPKHGVDLNHATPKELAEIEGLGPRMAEAIVSYRRARGELQSVDQLSDVPGFDGEMLERLRPNVRV